MISDLYELQSKLPKTPQPQEAQVVHSPYEMPIMIGAAAIVAMILIGRVWKRGK